MADLTLTDFLLARIAEDETVARSAVAPTPTPAHYRTGDAEWEAWAGWDYDRDADLHHVCVEPHRVLAECKAKRSIIDLHYQLDGGAPETFPYIAEGYGEPRVVWPACAVCDEGSPRRPHCDTIRILAAVYADHPDYLEEWRP